VHASVSNSRNVNRLGKFPNPLAQACGFFIYAYQMENDGLLISMDQAKLGVTMKVIHKF
jgi:hypothetical protein